ncbi:MAG: NfeD family protein [Gammaproteobacteria bacterium]|nr:NfeD family protein [Gammaproteobacteria bacterium]
MLPVVGYIDAHQAEFWIFVGFALVAIETLVLGLASGVLLFGAIGALLTGILMMAGVLPETWTAGIAGFGILAAVSTAVLWRPLMRLQHGRAAPGRDRTSDLIGYEFTLPGDIDTTRPSSVSYSGITWEVRPDPELAAGAIPGGTRVRVAGVDAGVFWVVRARA